MSEIWETHQKHLFMGAGRYDNKRGVGFILNRKWRQQIIDAEYINERVITAAIVVNHQRIELTSVYFFQSGDADHHVEKCTEQSRNTRQTAKITYRLLEETSMLNWDLDMELNAEVLANTLNGGNKRGDWMKHWLMLQGITARCTERILGNKQPTDLQREMRSKSTTSYSREDT